MKTGLVLEGGAMRGMYTAGVLDILMENNVRFDGIAGTSAGALFGVNFLSKQNGRVIRYNKRFNKNMHYMGLLPLIKEGNIFSEKYAFQIVPRKIDPFDDEAYMKSGVPFYAVVTDVETGEPQYIKIDSVFEQMDTLRASGSMPFVSKPVEIGGRYYLDGGITDSIPFRWLSDQGYEKLVVILTRDMEYRKKPMSGVMIKLWYKDYPNLKIKLKKRHKVYNDSVEELKTLEDDGRAFVIRPSEPIRISRMEKNPDKLQSVYELGRKDGADILEKLKEYLK